MSTVTVQNPSDLNTDDGRMWHIVLYNEPDITLCGKKLPADAEHAGLNQGEVECIVCAEISKDWLR